MLYYFFKLIKLFYASFYYYFYPLVVIILTYFAPVIKNCELIELNEDGQCLTERAQEILMEWCAKVDRPDILIGEACELFANA